MEENNDEPVEFCNSCKSLYIVEDEFNNIWCKKCDSLNHTSTLPSIWQYIEKYNTERIDG